MARARTCYDHFAGRLGVAIADAMTEARAARSGQRLRAHPGRAGLAHRCTLGVDPDQLRPAKRPLARGCLDWTERRPHLAGTAGARALPAVPRPALGTADRHHPGVRVTPEGRAGLRALLGID